MNLRPLLPLVPVLLIGAGLPATADAKARSCAGPAKATTLASSSTARVYRVPVSGRERATGVVYGCLRAGGRTTRLARESDDAIETSHAVTATKLGGRYAVLVIETTDLSCKADCPPDFQTQRDVLRVTDLRTRRSRILSRDLIDPKSVRASATTVRWTTRAGVRGSASLAPPRTCAPRGSTTLAADGAAQVYRAPVKGGGDDGMTTGEVFGCRRSGGKPTLLATEYDDDFVTSGDVTKVVLDGRFALVLFAATDVSCKADCPPDYQSTHTTLSGVDLKRGRQTTLDTGAVDASSLRLDGAAATWTSGGTPKSASLK
jgi:hypothetical protein